MIISLTASNWSNVYTDMMTPQLYSQIAIEAFIHAIVCDKHLPPSLDNFYGASVLPATESTNVEQPRL